MSFLSQFISYISFTVSTFINRYNMHQVWLSWLDNDDNNIIEFSGIGFKGALITSPDLTKQVMKFPEFKKIRTENFDDTLGEGTGTTNDYTNWKERRLALVKFYSMLDSTDKTTDKELIERLYSTNQEQVDVRKIMEWYTITKTTKLILGYNYDIPETLVDDIHCLKHSAYLRTVYSFIPTIFLRPFGYNKILTRTNEFAEKVYENNGGLVKHLRTTMDCNEMTAQNIGKEQSEEGNKKKILEEIFGVLLPGVTHAIPISLILYELAKHKEIQETARQDEALLTKVVNEGLRLYPLYPILARKQDRKLENTAEDGDCRLENTVEDKEYKFDPNMELYCSPYVLGRSKTYKDPNEFNPYRSEKLNPTFGFSSRKCPAQKYVTHEIKSLLSTVLSKFKIEAVSDKVETQSIITIESEHPILLRFIPL